jgi:hypothetical protein
MSAAITGINPVSPDAALARYHLANITGTGFIANLSVAIYMRDSSGTPPGAFCATVGPTDGSGNLNAFFQIPNFGTPSGIYTVTACNAQLLPDGSGRSVGAAATINVTIL